MLCVALVLLSGTLSVTHSHEHSLDTHGTCGLCATAHAVAQVAESPAQVLVNLVFIEIEAATPVARPQTVPHFALFCRPPPVSVHLS